MRCPSCGFNHKQMAANVEDIADIPELAPFLCGECLELGVFFQGQVIKPSPEQLAAVKSSPAYKEFLQPTLDAIKKDKRRQLN